MTARVRSVVFLTYHFPPEVGGVQTRISKYVERLARRGIRVDVMVAGRNPSAKWRPEGVNVRALRGGTKRLPKNAAIVARSVIRSRADTVHVFTGASTLLGVCTLALARATGARAVMSLFGREDFALNLPARALLLLSTALAESIDVNSTATGALLREGVRKKVHVLLGAAEEPLALLGQASSQPVLLFVGRLVQRKGVDDLIRAFAAIKPRFPEGRLSVVGDGPEMMGLVELAEELGVQGSVEFKGTLVGAELEREYSRCSVFVLPSKDVPSDSANEGLGLTLIEASMHGKPLIGTRHGGIPELVEDGKNGLLVSPGNPTALAAALAEILSSEDVARRMGEAAAQMARSRFGWERATDVLLESYAKSAVSQEHGLPEKVERPRN